MDKLEDVLGLGEILEPVVAEVAQGSILGQLRSGELGGEPPTAAPVPRARRP